MATRLLVMGDNHGDVESLRRVHEAIVDLEIDLAVHVGDFTRAMRHDSRRLGAAHLRAVEPVLGRIADRTKHGLVWVYGNQDRFGDLGYDLDVGREIPADDAIEVAGERFTNDPERVDSETILVTHMERWALADSFDGRAHFCGNTHRGRHHGRRLNSAFLQVTHPGTRETHYGGFFVVELDDEMSVEMHSIGSLERRECPVHAERGVQFQPPQRECMFCTDERILYREIAASGFYRVTGGDSEAQTEPARLVEEAHEIWEDPPEGFRDGFTAYLENLESDRYAPLTHTANGAVTVAERSYAY